MPKQMWLKSILLLIAISIVTPTTTGITTHTAYFNTLQATTSDIVYVGGTGPGNYSTIQQAIDNASAGNTIYVYKNIYKENLRINKKLTLYGENRQTTIISGNNINNTIYITANQTKISNFTITQAGPTQFTAAIYVEADYCHIHHNILTSNTAYGIRIPIINNTGRIYTKITHNTITNNHIGIFLQLCAHTLIENNTIKHNTYGITTMIGFLVNGCQNTTIHHNHLSENNLGLDLTAGCESTITCNNFIHNTRHVKLYLETDTMWDQNYWDYPRKLPKIILGKNRFFLLPYPIINFDFNPAQDPYLVGETT